MSGSSCHYISSTKHEEHDKSDIFVLLSYGYQLRKIWENLISALDRKFLKPFPPAAGKCWHWPGGQFWNPVALVQTNSACSLGLLGTQTVNITPLTQISHLFICLTKLRILELNQLSAMLQTSTMVYSFTG